MSIGPSLTFSIRITSFFDFPTLFGCFVWNRPVVYRFISNIRTKTGLCPATRISSDVSLLYYQDIPDPMTINCKKYD